jgi:hypothetical protein
MITITTGLAAHVASFAPCIIAGTSSRDNVRTNGTLIQLNATGYQSGTGGRLAVTVASSGTDFEVGDTVLISGATGNLAQYNGRHEVYSVASGIITTTTTWAGGTTAAVGQITRSNDSLLVRADVYNGATLLGSVYATPSRRAFQLDVARTLQTAHSSLFTLTPGLASAAGAAYQAEVRLFEQWQRANYSTQAEQTSGATQTTVAHRVTSVASRTTQAMLNDGITSGGKVVLHFMTNAVQIRVRFIPSSGWATTYNIVPTLDHVLVVYEIPDSVKYVTVDAVDVDTLNTIKAPIIVKAMTNRCGKRLYYLNRQGGYSVAELVDYEILDEADRVERSPVRSLEVVRGKGQIEARYNTAYLDGLADSPEVYDEQGRRVYLRTANVVKWANETQLEVEYERDQLTMI